MADENTQPQGEHPTVVNQQPPVEGHQQGEQIQPQVEGDLIAQALPPPELPTQGQQERLNSTTRSEACSHRSRGSSCWSSSDEVLEEIRDMNKSIKLLLQSHLKDSERLERVEQRMSVSSTLINTSVGVAMNP
jgi:hypothetical protein